MNSISMTYALVFALTLTGCRDRAAALEPVYRLPVATLSTTLKGAGHERIAQGLQIYVGKDKETDKLFSGRSPIMVTTNKQTGEWSVSVIHDKEVGSVLLTGTALHQGDGAESADWVKPDRAKAQPVMARLGDFNPAYYADDLKKLTDQGFRRAFSGKVSAVGDPSLKKIMSPVFLDILVKPDKGEFVVLAVDQTGACATLAVGENFSEKVVAGQ